MSSVMGEHSVFDNEIAFCKIYSQKAKQELERVFLRHRISYFVEWEDESIWQKLFPARDGRVVCTIRINKADFREARELVKGIPDIKVRNVAGMEEHDPVKDLARKKKIKENIDRKEAKGPVIRKTSGGRSISETRIDITQGESVKKKKKKKRPVREEEEAYERRSRGTSSKRSRRRM